jgi:hypothetical protein
MKMKAEDLLDYEIDVDGLRRDMKEEYVAAMCCGFPMAVVDLTEVERMSDRELVEQALKNGVDLRMYRV